MSEQENDFGLYGQCNRKFLPGIYKPKPNEVFLKISAPSKVPLPAKYNICEVIGLQYIMVYDQGRIGSCTANAIASAYNIMNIIKNRRTIYLSRLFIYYNERAFIGKIEEDSGAYIKDGFKSMQKEGACLEKHWPYIESKFAKRPDPFCYHEARNHRTNIYNPPIDPRTMVMSMKLCISMKMPVVIGVLVYESFVTDEVSKTGYIPIPNTQTEKLIGGHAVLCVGYNDETQHFTFLNSWSNSFGNQGYGYKPYQFVGNNDLCNDCHSFLNVELRLADEGSMVGSEYNCLSPKNWKENLKDICNVI